jgi:hypothetical protein
MRSIRQDPSFFKINEKKALGGRMRLCKRGRFVTLYTKIVEMATGNRCFLPFPGEKIVDFTTIFFDNPLV